MTIILFIVCFLWHGRVKADSNAVCGEDVILKCPANLGYDVEYRAVSWYLVSIDHLNGILRWDRRTGSVRKFMGLNRTVGCPTGDGLTLELRNLTAEDRGLYRCSLSAPIGQHNTQGDIQLSVTGCAQVVDSFGAEEILLCGGGALALLGITLCILFICCAINGKNRFPQEENVLTGEVSSQTRRKISDMSRLTFRIMSSLKHLKLYEITCKLGYFSPVSVEMNHAPSGAP